MNGRKSKQLRRESVDAKPKRYFKPFMVPRKMRDPEDASKEIEVQVAMPRHQRRLMMRKFKTDLKKGRIDDRQIQREGV